MFFQNSFYLLLFHICILIFFILNAYRFKIFPNVGLYLQFWVTIWNGLSESHSWYLDDKHKLSLHSNVYVDQSWLRPTCLFWREWKELKCSFTRENCGPSSTRSAPRWSSLKRGGETLLLRARRRQSYIQITVYRVTIGECLQICLFFLLLRLNKHAISPFNFPFVLQIKGNEEPLS